MNTLLKIYLKDTINLVKGIRLKSETTANAINEDLARKGYVIDDGDPSTWRYYLNLSGRYHEADQVMKVTSHDTYETIDFTRENLQIHLLTARNYVVGSQFYQELVSNYPEQESLIQGIIDPVDVQTAISAKDHTILTYPSQYVEANEGYLIPALQKYITNFFTTRHNRDYTLFDPQYYVGLLAIIATSMVLEILRLRQSVCKTDKAHTFHVKQYLLSNSKVGEEFHFMTHDQRMWLYRNIRYINRHIGQNKIFEELTERFLTSRGFSLVGYDLRKSSEGMPGNLVPDVEFSQSILNNIPPASGSSDKTIPEIIARELTFAPDNDKIYDLSEERLKEIGESSLYGTVPTKILESDAIDRTDSDPFTITEISTNHWVYLAHLGRYNAAVQIVNPGNGERYNLTMKEALIMYLYSINAALGMKLTEIPSMRANRVIRNPLPTFEELRTFADTDLVSDNVIRHILSTQPTMGSYISVEAFRGFCKELWETQLRHRELRFFSGDYRKEGQLHTVVDRAYMDIMIPLADGMNYGEWLSYQGITVDNLSSSDFFAIADEIVTHCTGADLQDSTSIRDVHRSMLRIMTELSSYSVQYLSQINDSSIKVIDGKVPFLSDNQYREHTLVLLDTYYPKYLEMKVSNNTLTEVGIKNPDILSFNFDGGVTTVDIGVDVTTLGDTRITEILPIRFISPTGAIRPIDDTSIDGVVEVENPIEIQESSVTWEPDSVVGYLLTPARISAFKQRG